MSRPCKYETDLYNYTNTPFTFHEMIEVWEMYGYPYNERSLESQLKESYIECKVDFDTWYKKILKKAHANMKVKEALGGKLKMCNKCRKIKPYSSFYVHHKTLDGITNDCKMCSGKGEYAKQWKHDNIDKYEKSYRLQNMKVVLIKQGYYFTDEQLEKLVDLKISTKMKSNIKLIDMYKDELCLTKMWD